MSAQQDLEAGATLSGIFWPAGTDLGTPGVLSWSDELGARLQLTVLDDPWPTDFNRLFTIHAQLHGYIGTPLTLMQSRVTRKMNLNQPAEVAAQTLAFGAHTDLEERWPVANFMPYGLHEWYPETGLSIKYRDKRLRQPQVSWKPPKAIKIPIPGARITLQPGAGWGWGFGPGWRIDTTLCFTVRPDKALTLNDFWREYRSPLLAFVMFASDRPDDLRRESYYNARKKRQIVVLHASRQVYDYDWRPNDGHYLFKAENIDSEVEVIQRWMAVWRRVDPALGYFGEYIAGGNAYSPDRFLALCKTAENYWKRVTGERNWKLAKLCARAAIHDEVSHCDKDAIALMGQLRNYHGHLSDDLRLTPEEISDGTFVSTRRLYLLMQACLLRELGLETDRIEELIQLHYRSWPVP
ncbi:MAG TPA: HEPN domain-containing protein [Solirubrobacteraceae bacterium]